MNRSNEISLAIGADIVVGVRGDRTIRVSREGGGPLADALSQVARELNDDGRRASVDVALMPSLCEVRLIALPPMRAAEAEAVITRDAGKYFTVSNERRVIGVLVPRRARMSTTASRSDGIAPHAPIMAAAVSQRVMDEIAGAIAHTGWTVRRITPASAAWLHAAGANAGRETPGRARAFVAVDQDTAHVMRIEHGSPVELRRFSAHNADAVASALGNNAGTALLLAPEGLRGPLGSALSSRGWSVLPSGDAATGAAKHAGSADLVLLSDADHVRRAARQNALANRLAAAAVILVLAGAIIMQWGARREVDALHQRRIAIHERVAPLLALRDSVDAIDARTSAADEIFNDQSHWSRTLYELTMLLPKDAHLTRLNATGDTIVIEGEAARAGDVLEAIGRAPTLRNVEMRGPVQRDLADGATTAERFVIQASLAVTHKQTKTKKHVAAPPRAVATDVTGGIK